jgi:dipeptidyl-peptidase-3
MRNRALIANWIYTHANGDVALEKTSQGKTFLRIRDYDTVRKLAAQLLAQIQQIKSMGLYEEARKLVETYAVKIDRGQHIEVLARYEKLRIAPYKGFINPRMTPVTDSKGNITDIIIDYSETYDQQMMRYSVEYGYL